MRKLGRVDQPILILNSKECHNYYLALKAIFKTLKPPTDPVFLTFLLDNRTVILILQTIVSTLLLIFSQVPWECQ